MMWPLLSRWGVPVTLVTERRTKDRYGNVTTARTETPVARALFEPAQQVPRTDADSPGVTSPAKFYFEAGVAVSEDDVIRDAQGRDWIVTSVQDWPLGVEAAVKRWGTT